jgi:hypothetical protein
MYLNHQAANGAFITRQGVINGEPVTFPVPMYSLGFEVYALPSTRGYSIEGSPVIGLVFDEWVLIDSQKGRDLPMRYEGRDIATMKRFAETYAYEGRGLHGADLDLFCESWRDRNGIGAAPMPR